jgi:hypothetical protein
MAVFKVVDMVLDMVAIQFVAACAGAICAGGIFHA